MSSGLPGVAHRDDEPRTTSAQAAGHTAGGPRAGGSRRAVAALLTVLALGALGSALWALARGPAPFVRLGVSAPPPWIAAAVPVVRLAVTAAGGACLGLLLGAAVGRPTGRGARDLGPHGYRGVRHAGVAAAVWAAASSLASLLTVVAATGGSLRALAGNQFYRQIALPLASRPR